MKLPGLLAVLVLALVCGAAAGAAQAPQSYRIGMLSVGADPTDQSPFGAGLIRGFARHGLVLGQNLAFERRAAHGQLDRLPQLVDGREQGRGYYNQRLSGRPRRQRAFEFAGRGRAGRRSG